jgi:hypothetical protein
MTTIQKENTNNWIKINGLWQQKIPLISIEQSPQPIINVNISPGTLEKIKKEQEDSRIRRFRRRNTELIAKIEKCAQETVQRQKIEYNYYKKNVEYENEKIKESHVRVEKNKMLKEEYEKYKTSIEDSHKKIKKQIDEHEEEVRNNKIQKEPAPTQPIKLKKQIDEPEEEVRNHKIQKEPAPTHPIKLKIFEEDWAILENIKTQTHSSQENKMSTLEKIKIQQEEQVRLEKIKMQEEEERKHLEKTQGFVYCFSNTHEHNKGLYKIGKTTRTPTIRAKEVSKGAGVIGKWQVEFAKHVSDCHKVEDKLHLIFWEYQYSGEIFKVNINEIRKEFDLLQGEWYHPHNTQKITSHFNYL